MTTTTAERSGQFALGDRTVHRLGYGAMQLAGPHVMGPPADRDAAVAVLRRAVELGVDHIDTSDYYGPHVTNEVIREALHPYPEQLTIVTKVGARRTPEGEWPEALSPDELRQAVHDNLDHLGVDVIDVVNLRMPGFAAPVERSLAEPFETLAELQQQGLIRHLGVSNVTTQQFAEARAIAPVVCVQNHYNLVHRDDDPMVDALAREGVAYVPFFPLGGFTPLQSAALETVARRLETTPMQVALAWLLARSPNILLIPGTSSVAHLEENLQAAARVLGPAELEELDRIGGTGEPDVDL
ncbi:aldo/keto reductase family oxidoreductase [Geodermatophilus aquaeductus]|jgi:pyridoxine 4-dehydrogenase|uniref:Predicted oxidoreductase n=1 Tax=Geodermatophilus aquaeductus TaxID=1564161 RepID=A0A521C307_9ACTN|nr:aldo/keto reductase family oxidoreductase [Geodermatophilus aquaeductus]SMO53788.1 Predicted oxidoreductase [Geodermatophilus aquaeductus]